MQRDAEEDTRMYQVVVNHEEQFSIWLQNKEIPLGWEEVGISGPKEKCLEHIKKVWTDMRPKSLRESMEANNVG